MFVDHNRYRYDGTVSEVMALAPLPDKWCALGWRVEETDGHDYGEILGLLDRAHGSQDRPSLAVACTIKGHGVSFMEGSQEYHARLLTREENWRAPAELDTQG